MDTDFTRREVIAIGVAAAAGVTVGATTAAAVSRVVSQNAEGTVASATVPFHGRNQAGIGTALQAQVSLIALDLLPATDKEALARLLRLWTTDIALLTAGKPAMADSNPEIAAIPASLTVTVGLGFTAFEKIGMPYEWPIAVRRIPDYPKIDQLRAEWCDGDVVLQVCSDDRVAVAHAVRELLKDAAPFASLRWVQDGYSRAAGGDPNAPHRNLFGMIEGTDNPLPSEAAFASTVWNRGDRHPWFQDGTTMVVRRIQMNLDKWESLKPQSQEKVFGRKRSNGAPLTGNVATDVPDYNAVDATGALVIPESAHMRRASFEQNILRRPFNYDMGLGADGRIDAGLLFIAFCAEIEQYMTIQDSLANLDALNAWTIPIGSALFAVLPGAEVGEWLGQSILEG